MRSANTLVHVWAAMVASWLGIAAGARAEPPKGAEPPPKALPLGGETLLVAGRPAFLIPPKEAQAKGPTPWVWYAPTLPGLPSEAERWMFERFTAAGLAIAGIDVGESFGSPDGRAKYSALYRTLIEKRGMAPKPVLLARSRGGLMLLAWATDNPDKVGGLAGIYPVFDLTSYPGIETAAGAYGLSVDAMRARLMEVNPIERTMGLAKAKVPLFAIHGDQDTVVPLERNSGALASVYRAQGGSMELIVPKGQGHNMWPGFFECEELVAFVLAVKQTDNGSDRTDVNEP